MEANRCGPKGAVVDVFERGSDLMDHMKPLPPMDPIPASVLERLKGNYIFQAWLVLMLALFFGASLAGVHLKLGPQIERNKLNETLERIPEILLGTSGFQGEAGKNGQLVSKPHTIPVDRGGRRVFYTVYEARFEDGRLAGWVAKASGQGYADKIELLIGFSPDLKTLTGIFILGQKETPGLGNKIITIEWRKQFRNIKVLQPIEVVKGGAKGPNQIDAITGATISSRSVTRIVNTAVRDLRGPLAALAKQVRGER